jgi:hypothetical protein
MQLPSLKMIFRATVAAGICAFFSAGLVTSILEKGLGSSDSAGWVQVIGSIAAIIGAFMVANRQHQTDKEIQRQSDAYERKQRYAIVSAILRKVRARLYIAASSREANEFSVAHEVDVEQLRTTTSLLDALPPFEMPGAKIMMLCLALRDQIEETADLLDDERNAHRSTRPPLEQVVATIDNLSHSLDQAIRLCGSLSPSFE